MILTTDGRAFVFGVFGSDGCECEALEAIFADEESAKKYVAHLQEPHSSLDASYPFFYGKSELLSVRILRVH